MVTFQYELIAVDGCFFLALSQYESHKVMRCNRKYRLVPVGYQKTQTIKLFKFYKRQNFLEQRLCGSLGEGREEAKSHHRRHN